MKIRSIRKNNNISYTIVVSLFFSITFFLFEPIKNYLANSDEYWFTLNKASVYYFMLSFFSAICICLIFWGISHFNALLANRNLMVIGIVTMGMYIQSNVLPNTLGVLDGHPVDWAVINTDIIFSDILWLVILGLTVLLYFVLYKKFDVFRVVRILSVCFMLLEASICLVLFIKKPEDNHKYEYTITDLNECRLSKKENFIIFVSDAFDASYMTGQVSDERAEALFKDFTFYSNVLSMYGHTDASIPQMLTGHLYKNEITYKDYLVNAYSDSPILDSLIDEDWDIGLYLDGHLPKCGLLSKVTNLTDIDGDFTSKRHFIKSTYRLVAYSVVPYRLKKYFWFEPDFSDLKDSPSDEFDFYNYKNGEFYEDEERINYIDNRSVFRFYHIRGMHLPMQTTSEGIEQGESVSLEECREANYKIFERIIDSLKQEGVYDNSVIMIMAGHGQSEDDSGTWKQNPILMIKGKNEHHPFEESSLCFSYKDLQGLYFNLKDGKNGMDVFDGIDVSGNEGRYFYRYEYGHETLDNKTFPKMTEYITYGDASAIDDFEATGLVY